MADNTKIHAGDQLGDDIATDDIGGIKHQRVKIQYGVDGSATDVSDTNPLPIDDAGGSITVDGSVSIGAAIPAGNNNIGDVDVASTVGTVADGAAGLPAVIYVVAGWDGTNVQALATDSSGLLQVDVATAPTTAVTGPLTDAQLRATAVPVSLATVPSHAVTNAGTFAVQVDGNALTALQLIDDTVFTDDAAFTVGTSKVTAIGLMADQSSTDSVNEGDVGIPRMTLDRKQIATLAPSNDTEGLSIFRSLDLDETEEEVKATAGKVYGYTFFNAAASTRYLKFYNATAANVTVGTTTPVITVGLPAGAAGHIPWDMGIAFGTAITAAVTTAIADADTGAPGANDVSINIFYV